MKLNACSESFQLSAWVVAWRHGENRNLQNEKLNDINMIGRKHLIV